MANRPTLMVTFAVAGSGKSYIRGARFVADEFLPERDGVHYSNFPLKVPEICAFAAKQTGKPVEDFERRVWIIPQEEMAKWSAEQSGPWDYFKETDLQDAHIAIDEAHNFCGEKHSAAHRRKWQVWLGELRHRGACCELISQDEGKMAREVVKEAGQRIALVNSEARRDPFFNITCGEWYELRAGFLTGEYEAAVWEVEQRRVMSRWVTERERKFRFEQRYFDLYDSYNTPHGGGVKAKNPPHEYMRRTKRGLLWWFFRRNAWSLTSRPLLLAVLVWVFFFGGWKIAVDEFVDLQKSFLKAKPGSATAGAVPTTTPTPGQPTLADPVEVATRLRKELTDAEAAVKALTLRAEKAEGLARKYGAELGAGYRLTLITGEACTFKNGVSYRVGDAIEDGPYKGQRIETLDWPRRRVILAGGQFIQLGAEPLVDLAELENIPSIEASRVGFAPGELPPPADFSNVKPVPLDERRMQTQPLAEARRRAAADVSPALRPPLTDAVRAELERHARENGDALGQRNAARGVLPLGQQSNGGVYSSGTGPRR